RNCLGQGRFRERRRTSTEERRFGYDGAPPLGGVVSGTTAQLTWGVAVRARRRSSPGGAGLRADGATRHGGRRFRCGSAHRNPSWELPAAYGRLVRLPRAYGA